MRWPVLQILVPTGIGLALYLFFYRSSDIQLTQPLEMAEKDARSVYEFTVKNATGEDVPLETYRGKVLLIVNIASLCGLTASNYKELVDIDQKYREAGLRILAFPCNQFGKQEPGTNEEVVCFARKNNANFDIFGKIDVNGPDAHPLYKYLKNAQSGWFGNAIKWNFTKFIVNKEGIPVERHAPTTPPSKLIPSIEKYLAE
ncbi:glutathione peroxidase [Nesidiocoris tenuis]|uniref:Glutathione peroxidase n=1 Tax=Nesidiocoris tenuis TaxID=355587 RepID=A0ABN7ACV4_9HEMI|nr:glutathione peroxidase [Nesidiocoris tenuis]